MYLMETAQMFVSIIDWTVWIVVYTVERKISTVDSVA